MKRVLANNYKNNYKSARPFWLPALNYYILTIGFVLIFFILIWGVLRDENQDSPWITASVFSGLVFGGAVVLREFVLRKAHNRFLLAQRKLDYNLKSVPPNFRKKAHSNKLTLQENAEIIRNIKQKSDAARVLGKLSDGHLEVFEICNEYLLMNEREMKYVGIGSPRLAALRRGKEIVQSLHKFHLLNWVELEAKTLTQEAKNKVALPDKLEKANHALSILDSARHYYPNEIQIIKSEEALREFVASIKIAHWIEEAERHAFKSDYKQAISNYKDALFFLARENVRSEDKDLIAGKINIEIARLREKSKIKTRQVSSRGNKGEIYD